MSKQQGKPNIADDAARARKLLDKHAPVKVSGLNKGNFTLQQGVNQNIGEHAVIVIISEQTVHQYTISHPIGVTDGDEKLDWVINSTEYLPSMMARKADPAAGALNQSRAQLRTQLAIEAGLLVSKMVGDKHVHYYPNRDDMSRNDLLQEARMQLKGEQQQLRQEIDGTEDRARKNALNAQLAQLVDPTEYLDSGTATSEENLRKFWQSEEVLAVIESETPQLYRTLTGPYADQPQVIIAGAKGKSLDTVVNAVSARIAKTTIGSQPRGPALLTTDNPTEGGTSASGVVTTPQNTTDAKTKVSLRANALAFAKKILSLPKSTADPPAETAKVETPTVTPAVTPQPPTVSPPRSPAKKD
jgi:hypothetical protein